jgi:hypothetical protein
VTIELLISITESKLLSVGCVFLTSQETPSFNE